jgi:ParB family chromosome partitioning protein
MSENRNPFNDRLDWALQGKYVEVLTDEYVYRGWVEMVHHQRGSLVMHDCERRVHPKHTDEDWPHQRKKEWENVGSTFIRTPNHVTCLKREQSKNISFINPEICVPYDEHALDFEPTDHHMRLAHRNHYTGGFPVVRELYEEDEQYDINQRFQILNGHKRVEAARRVGLQMHPMEVVHVTDEQAEQLFKIAHREQFQPDSDVQEAEEATDTPVDEVD